MYKAQMIASAVVYEGHVEGFAEIVKPALSTLCSGELTENTNCNSTYSVFGIVTDPDFKYDDSEVWAEALSAKLTPRSSVQITLYLTDEEGVEHWSVKENGVYVIMVGEDEDEVHIDPDDVIWG